MQLRDEAEHAIRRWHALEVARDAPHVIDYDCSGGAEGVTAYPDRLTALNELTRLNNAVVEGSAAAVQLEAHAAYLRALLGERLLLNDYIESTQRCGARGWSREYLDYRGELARGALNSLGVTWDADTQRHLQRVDGDTPLKDPSGAIREYADKYEPVVRELTGATVTFNLSIENVRLDAYWSYWLDGAGQNARLRINLNNATFTATDAYKFALHEILGHALQYANLAEVGEAHPVDWLRVFSIHGPYQVLFEGLGQVLPLIVSPGNERIEARIRLDHYLQLVRAELHLLVNSGESAMTCRDFAQRRVPFWNNADIARELSDRSVNPQLRTYLWAYPAGIDWFVNLHDTRCTPISEVLHAAYQRPLSPHELRALWPTGPVIGGDQ